MRFGLGKPETVEDTMLLLQARYTFFLSKTAGGGEIVHFVSYLSALYTTIFSSLEAEILHKDHKENLRSKVYDLHFDLLIRQVFICFVGT